MLHANVYGAVPPLPLAVSVALAPLQMFTVAGAIEAAGGGLTLTVRDVVAVHPFASVTETL